MSRPTPEEIAAARARLGEAEFYSAEMWEDIAVLLAATEPPTDEEIAIERRSHFRMTPHRRPNGPTFCVDQRGDHGFDVYFDDRPGIKVDWTPLQVWQFGRWSLHAGRKP